MQTLSVLNASIVMPCHTFFVVHVVKSAIVAICMQTGSSQYVILRVDYFGFHTRSVKNANYDCSGMKTTVVFIKFRHPVGVAKCMLGDVILLANIRRRLTRYAYSYPFL